MNGSSPYELVYKTSPSIDKLIVFGYLCFLTKLNNLDKFFERANKCIFVGYASNKKVYNVLSLDKNIIFVSRDINFDETMLPFKLKSLSSPMIDKPNNILNASDSFSYDESLLFSTLHDTASLDDLRGVHHRDGTNAVHNLDETGPFIVNIHTGEAYVSPSNGTIPSSSTLTDESGQINPSPSEGKSTRVTRSRCDVHMSVRISDYVVKGRHKYGIEKYVSYSSPNIANLCLCLI